jgi:predicted transcriptional regulator
MAEAIDAKQNAVRMTADIVAAYVSKNSVSQAELPRLIGEVHRALTGAMGQGAPRDEANDVKPAISVKKSITNEYIVCLEDGKKFKSLKRHLRSHHDMGPEQYREKWGLPADYPMVALDYAKTRSSLAKRMGLGRRKGKT